MAAIVPVWLLTAVCLCCLLQVVSSQEDAVVSFSVREELRAGHYIGSVALESKLFDNVPNEEFQRLEFHITPNAELFRIEINSSLLWTKTVIDREKLAGCSKECVVTFNVVVYNLDAVEKTKLIKVQVTIEDFNDNRLQFTDIQQPLLISEATEVNSVLASGATEDLDEGIGNSVRSYYIIPSNNVFEVKMSDEDKTLFDIILTSSLDREKQSSYRVVIVAVDGASPPLNGSLTLDIEVTDDNDNFPTFAKKDYNISVFENTYINSTILLLYASDNDSADNGKVSYAFDQRVSDKVKDTFRINDTTGELTVAGVIDFEVDKIFKFKIEASDHGDPPKRSTADITIHVRDINDNVPEINISQPPGGTVLSEMVEDNSYVALLKVSDADSGDNGKVSCEVLDDRFKLEEIGLENNYKILVNGSLDHDTEPNHNVTIICTDFGETPNQGMAHFIVHVEDYNDNYPIFTELIYRVSIVENNKIAERIVAVSASDLDSGNNGKVTYSLSNNTDDIFVINSVTGIISANTSLDREVHGDELTFYVQARDDGKPARTATGTVRITILDQNDNAPEFLEPLTFKISERQQNNSIVGSISVRDPDKGLNGTYHLRFPTGGSVNEYFNFEPNGLITTREELDREQIAYHEFYVDAVDGGGRTSSALYRISVLDINDNQPEIIYPSDYNNEKLVPISLELGSEVLQIHGRDYDEGQNAQLHYFIDQDNATSVFWLNEHTGKMVLNSTLETSDVGTVFSFVIRVKDSGQPSLSSSTTLHLRIIEGDMKSKELVVGQTNLWIVVAIVSITAVLALIMVAIIVKMHLSNRRKDDGKTPDLITESNEVNPRLIDSSSSSTSSKDSNYNEKLKIQDGSLQLSSGSGSLHSVSQEKNSMLDTSLMGSQDALQQEQNLLYMEKVKQLGYELTKKIDETNSDNSGEMETRDSGQGGSDIDMNSLSELPVLDIPECASITDTNSVPSPLTYFQNDLNPSNRNNSPNGNRSMSSPSTSNHSNGNNDHTSESSFVPKSTANFRQPAFKTAERKELSKLRKNQKRVMFSDDLENSHSSGRSSTMSSLSFSDINNTVNSVGPPRQFSRMHSEEPPSRVSDNFRSTDLLRRSVDNLSWHRNGANRYKQFPGNTNNTHQSAIDDFQNRSLDSSNVSKWRNETQNKIFSLTREHPKSSSSHDSESTMSGSYSLAIDDYASSPGADNVFPKDLYV